jgi:glycosyltransferase involved in cell wall biosynthesis
MWNSLLQPARPTWQNPFAPESATVIFLRPLSIFHVDTAETWRGGQESLLMLARGLRTRGYRQAIVCPPSSALAERAQADGFSIAKLGLRTADIVHAHSGRAQNAAFWETFRSAVRRVVTRHVAFPPTNPWLHRLKYKWTCHGIIAVSDAVRRGLIESGVPAAKIETIHTGIEMPEPVGRNRLKFGLSDTDFVIGHMGAFTAEKGQDVAVTAAALVRLSLPRARMVLAGEGPLLDENRRTAPANVTFSGFVSDRAAFFAALDVFIMPSRSEAWGLAALEAMAHGVPVIASDVGGLPEIVEAGTGGWLIPSGDAAALARAITLAAADPEGLVIQGQRARERARLFSVERMVEQTEVFYRRFIMSEAVP